MKPLVCMYCEGNDTKVAVVTKANGRLSVLRTTSVDYVQPSIGEAVEGAAQRGHPRLPHRAD